MPVELESGRSGEGRFFENWHVGRVLFEMKKPPKVVDFQRLRKMSRDDWIRTSDLYVPNVARYRAALHPAFSNF